MDRCRALIVDEDRPFVERLGRALAAIGFSADEVRDRHAALDSVRQRRPAIVILAIEDSEHLCLGREIREIVEDVPLLLVRSGASGVEMPTEHELAPATVVRRPKDELDEAAILAQLDRSLRLGLDRSERERLAATVGPATTPDPLAVPKDDASGPDGLRAELTTAFERWRTRLDEAEASLVATIREGASHHREELAAVESECRAELEVLRKRQATERDRQRREAAERHQEELAAEREAHRLEVESLRELRAELEARQRSGSQELERAKSELEAARAELDAERETHRKEIAELETIQGSIENRERESVEDLEQITAALEHDLTREAGRRVSELEETEHKHRSQIAEIESRYREEIELLRKLHAEEIEQLNLRSTRDRERQEREHVSALKALAQEQRDTTDRLLDQREQEWRATLERERSEHARLLEAERAEFRVVLDALRGPGGAGSPTAQSTLLEVVEQLESSLGPDEHPGDPRSDRSD